MSNTITIELCQADRDRVNHLIDRLDGIGALLMQLIDSKATAAPTDDLTAQLKATLDKAKQDPAEAPKNAAGATEEKTAPNTQPAEEVATAEEPAPSAEAEKPTVTLEQIQQKVVQLAAGNGGAKKAKVREIVNAYAKKVSDLPADKWTEVWDKLIALEKEG
jgi:hypothetical protein